MPKYCDDSQIISAQEMWSELINCSTLSPILFLFRPKRKFRRGQIRCKTGSSNMRIVLFYLSGGFPEGFNSSSADEDTSLIRVGSRVLYGPALGKQQPVTTRWQFQASLTQREHFWGDQMNFKTSIFLVINLRNFTNFCVKLCQLSGCYF